MLSVLEYFNEIYNESFKKKKKMHFSETQQSFLILLNSFIFFFCFLKQIPPKQGNKELTEYEKIREQKPY